MNDTRRIRGSATFPPHVIAEIQRAGAEGIYSIRGAGAKRPVPDFDDLVFLGASVSRYPLEDPCIVRLRESGNPWASTDRD